MRKLLIVTLLSICVLAGCGSSSVRGRAKTHIGSYETLKTARKTTNSSKNKDKFLLKLEKYLNKKVAKKVRNVLKKKIGFTKLKFVQQLGETDNYQIKANGHDIVVTASDKLYRIFTPYKCTWYEDGKVKKIYKKIKKAKKKNVTNNPFPDIERYTINNMLIKYNSIARYPIDKKYMKDMKSVSRPLGRACITISNGAYFIMTYNDYNHMLFIDYQEEAVNDSSLVPVVEDMIKTINPKVKKKKFAKMWKKLRTGDYANYYRKQYKIGGFKINYMTNGLNNGETSYMIKTEYNL